MAVINANKLKLSDAISLDEVMAAHHSNSKIKENIDCLIVTEIQACFNFISTLSISSRSFPRLSILSLACNNIEEIPRFDCCPNLLELNLSKNSITRLENLDLILKLRVLNISSNRLTVLENISQHNSLEKLLLSCNNIKTIKHSTLPSSLHSLTHLGLLDNNLDTLNEIVPLLESAPNLVKFSIGLNPVTENNLLSTSYLLTDLRIPKKDILNSTAIVENDVSENARILRIRQFILSKCSKLECLDLSPISPQ